MTKYDISENEIIISTEVENERYLTLSTMPLIEQAEQYFDSWYAEQYDCNSLIRNSDELWNGAVFPFVKKGIEMLNAQGVYTIDERMFLRKYIGNECSDVFLDVVDDIKAGIKEIDGQANQEYQYRELRKASRGRMVGGGFGLGGALKGMATAGAINATTGVAHSIGNVFGNMSTSIAASANKSTLFKDAREPLKEAISKSVAYAVDGIRTALEKEAGIKCRYATVSECNTANAILNNYKQNRIPENQKKEQLIKALQLNLYDLETYYLIWEKYGDENGELRKMSSYFNVGLEAYLKSKAKEYGDDLYEKVCGTYEKAWNKRETAISLEKKITDALDNMIRYCNKCELTEEVIPAIGKCKKILADIDLDRRTVCGITYDTLELADNVREDYKSFYKALGGQDIFSDNAYECVAAVGYHTEEFSGNLPALFETERKLRIPEKICENLADIIRKNLDEKCYSEGVDIPGCLGSLAEKEKMIYTITGMPEEEVILLLFDRSSNGKSGVLISNDNVRIYSKGIFSNENQAYPIEEIEGIRSLANDEFALSVRGQSPIKFGLKRKKLAAEEQIGLARTMYEMVKVVKNLRPESRKDLYRILKGVIRCECGMNLLPGEKICPSCKRMLRENGTFTETEICPNCNSCIPAGKRFCSMCGFNLREGE